MSCRSCGNKDKSNNRRSAPNVLNPNNTQVPTPNQLEPLKEKASDKFQNPKTLGSLK